MLKKRPVEAMPLDTPYGLSREQLYELARDATERFHFYSIFPRFPVESDRKEDGELWAMSNMLYHGREEPLDLESNDEMHRISNYIEGWAARARREKDHD